MSPRIGPIYQKCDGHWSVVLILQNYSTEAPSAPPCTPYCQEPSTSERKCFRASYVASRRKEVDGRVISIGIVSMMCVTNASRDMRPLVGDWGDSVSIWSSYIQSYKNRNRKLWNPLGGRFQRGTLISKVLSFFSILLRLFSTFYPTLYHPSNHTRILSAVLTHQTHCCYM